MVAAGCVTICVTICDSQSQVHQLVCGVLWVKKAGLDSTTWQRPVMAI